ncbi:hypothetical protein J6V86_00650 [bacterium]|nr:hypothetical protein [bacterium]
MELIGLSQHLLSSQPFSSLTINVVSQSSHRLIVVQFIHLGMAIEVVSQFTVYVIALTFDVMNNPNVIKLVHNMTDSFFILFFNILKICKTQIQNYKFY